MAKALTDQIADLKAKKEKLAARLNTLSAKAKQEDRKNETRRKIVVGAAVLLAIEKDEGLATQVRKIVRQFVSRENDRYVVADLIGPSPPLEAAPIPHAQK